MDATMVLTGLTAVSGIIVFPLVMEYFRQHMALLACAAFMLILLYALSPYSPEARAILAPLHALPQGFADAVFTSADKIIR